MGGRSAREGREGAGGQPAEPGHPGPRLRVVASIAPLADLARRVCAERCEVATLVPPGASAHTWEPTPRDAARLTETDVFFEVGLGYESWLAKIVRAGDERFEIVDGSEGVDLIHGGGANPHYWLDPIAMKGAVGRFAEALARKDSEHAEEYRERASRLAAELERLDSELRDRTLRFTLRKIVTFHAAWDYFARRYGLTVVASIEEFPGKEPGPRTLAEIVRLVRDNGLRAVFAEPQFPPKAAEAIAAECGVRVLLLDPIGGEGIPGRSDYFAMMRYNVAVMEGALR